MEIERIFIIFVLSVSFFLMPSCRTTQIRTQQNKNESCIMNSNCTEIEKCAENKCIDACISFSCGDNAWCDVKDHVPLCTCKHRFTGDPNTSCIELNCTVNTDCELFDNCENNSCVEACESISCGDNAWCDVVNHVAVCTCMDKHVGDPYDKCIRDECAVDNDCFEVEKCKEKNCVAACGSISCGDNSECDAVHHEASCVCPRGLIGDPLEKCVEKSCIVKDECNQFQECENRTCVSQLPTLKWDRIPDVKKKVVNKRNETGKIVG